MKLIFIFFFLFLIPHLILAKKEKEFTEFYSFFRKGEYKKALGALEKVKGKGDFISQKNFLIALCYKRLQDFEKASFFFKEAIRLGYKKEELFYEYGQVLYANNDLEKATRAFQISFKKGYLPAFSLYYQAHIAEILENPQAVKLNYLKVIKNEKADAELKQVAYLRLAELIYSKAKDKFKNLFYIQSYVIPLLEKGLTIDPDSEKAREIELRKDQILLEFNIHPLVLVNGRKVGKKGKYLDFTQKIKRDDNVTLETNRPEGDDVTYLDSWIYDNSLFASYRWIFGKRWIVTPEIGMSYVKYADSKNSEVYQNDSFSFSPALRSSWEHRFFNRRAGFLIDYEYSRARRNREAKKWGLQFYGQSKTFVFGERIRLWPNGDTTVKWKLKSYRSYRSDLNSKTKTFYADQIWAFRSGHLFVGLVILDFTTVEDPSSSTNSYFFRGDYLIPNSFGGLTFNFNLNYNLLDTKLQSETRGTEKTLGVGFKLSRRLGKVIKAGLFYDYTKSSSLSRSYSYEKKNFGLELRWNIL